MLEDNFEALTGYAELAFGCLIQAGVLVLMQACGVLIFEAGKLGGCGYVFSVFVISFCVLLLPLFLN